MKPNLTSPRFNSPELPEAEFDCALATDRDAILPSSGFADSVMAAVSHEASMPPPIAFPLRRALPGFAAVVVALGVLIAAIVGLLRSAPAQHPVSFSMSLQTMPAPILHDASDVLWLALSLAVSVGSLLFCRRLISTR